MTTIMTMSAQQPQSESQYVVDRGLNQQPALARSDTTSHGLTIEECKAILPLPELMASYGDSARAKKSACCPFHADSSPSFGVNKDKHGKWLFNCFAGCGGGDEITYIAKKENLSNGDAIRRYRELVAEEQKFILEADHKFCKFVEAAENGKPLEPDILPVIEATDLLAANIIDNCII